METKLINIRLKSVTPKQVRLFRDQEEVVREIAKTNQITQSDVLTSALDLLIKEYRAQAKAGARHA